MKTDHELCLLLKLPYGFIPSVARPSLRFLGSLPNSGYKVSIFFHCGESTTCRNNPSHFLPFACHVKFFASLTLAKKRLNCGIIRRYHNTLARRPFFMSSSSPSSSFTLYLDTPHLGHLCNHSNYFLYNIQSFGQTCIFGTLNPLDIISSWPHSDWSAMYYL